MSVDSARAGMSKIRAVFIFAAIAAAAAVSLNNVSPALFPSTGEKAVSVKIEYRGAFEKEIEKLLIDLEEEFSGIKNIYSISSVAEAEKGSIYLLFSDSKDMDQAYLETSSCVDRVYAGFPENVQRPVITRNGENSFPVFIASFDKSRFPDSRELERIFSGINGCAEVETGGESGKEIFIVPDLEKLASSPFSTDTLGRKIAGKNVSATITDHQSPGGTGMRIESRIKSTDDLKSVFLGTGTRTGDFAGIRVEDKDTESAGRINGKESLILYAMKAGGANTVEVGRRLEKKALPPGGKTIYNSGADIEKALKETALSVAAGIIAVIFTAIVFFKKASPSILITMNILFSLLVSASVSKTLGFEIDIMILSGMSVAAGLAIDNSIILIGKYRYTGGDTGKTVRETFVPLLFSFLTTAIVFFPLVFAGEKTRLLFEGMAVSVVAGLAASLIFTFLFIPPFLDKRIDAGPEKNGKDRLRNIIKKTMAFFTGNPRLSALAALVATAAVFYLASSAGYEVFSFSRRDTLSFYMEYEGGVRFDYVKQTALEVEKEISAINGVTVTVRLEKERARFDISFPSYRELIKHGETIRKNSEKYKDIYFHFPDSQDIKESYDVNIYGKDPETIAKTAYSIADKITREENSCRIIYHFKSPVPYLNIVIDTGTANVMGLKGSEIYRNIYTALSAPVVSKLYENQGETDIRLGLKSKLSPAQIRQLPAGSRNRSAVHLESVASFREKASFCRIYRKNRQRVMSFSVINGNRKIIDNIVSSYPFEEGYRGESGALYNEKRKETKEFLFLLVLSFTFIFLTLAVQFESFRLPAIIAAQLPMTFLFPLAVLRMAGIRFSVITALALMLTAGISVNNSILVLYPFKGRKKCSLQEITESLTEKSQSIMMASLTTMLSIIPLLSAGKAGIFTPFSLTLAAGIAGAALSLPLSLSFACYPRRGKRCGF